MKTLHYFAINFFVLVFFHVVLLLFALLLFLEAFDGFVRIFDLGDEIVGFFANGDKIFLKISILVV